MKRGRSDDDDDGDFEDDEDQYISDDESYIFPPPYPEVYAWEPSPQEARAFYFRRRQRPVFDYSIRENGKPIKTHEEFLHFMEKHAAEMNLTPKQVRHTLGFISTHDPETGRTRYDTMGGMPLQVVNAWVVLLNFFLIKNKLITRERSIEVVTPFLEIVPQVFEDNERVIVIAPGIVETGDPERPLSGHGIVLCFERDEKTCIVLDPSHIIRDETSLYKFFAMSEKIAKPGEGVKLLRNNYQALPIFYTGARKWSNILFPNIGRAHDVPPNSGGDCGMLCMWIAFWICAKPFRKSVIPPPLPYHESLSMREWVMQCIYNKEITVPPRIKHYLHITGGKSLKTRKTRKH